MSIINVQLDAAASNVIAYFSAPQDVELWPNQAQIDTSDERWSSYYEAQLSIIQMYLPHPT